MAFEDRRLLFQTVLEHALGSDEVHFQKPTNLKMTYPAIVYHLDDEGVSFADNNPYNRVSRWMVTAIDRDPDSILRDKLGDLPMSRFDRSYREDNLNHFVFNIYF